MYEKHNEKVSVSVYITSSNNLIIRTYNVLKHESFLKCPKNITKKF